MNQDNVKGNLNKVSGKIKETVGGLTNNNKLKVEGKVQQIKGVAQDSLGHVKDAGRGAVESVKKASK